MNAFIKAFEIWAPLKQSTVLEFVQGEYGHLKNFKAVSENTTFAYDKGLPGKTWAAGHPIILTDLQDSYFERSEAAQAAGISAAIGLPVFAGQCLQAVLVFLCGDDDEVAGAIELWHCDENESHDLDFVDGYFGKLDHFEFLSKHTSFRKGVGLPGIVWESAMPKIFTDLGHSHRFVRSADATESGITSGLGIPFFYQPNQAYVMTFLSALGTPIARQIELWVPAHDNSGMMFMEGYAQNNFDLNVQYKGKIITRGEGVLGRTFLTGMPEICKDENEIYFQGNDAAKEFNMQSLISFPVLHNGVCESVVALYL